MQRRACTNDSVHGARDILMGVTLVCVACTRAAPPAGPVRPSSPTVDTRVARVSLGIATTAAVSATGPWRLVDRDMGIVARGDSGERATLTFRGAGVQISEPGSSVQEFSLPLSLVADNSVVIVNGRRYRGELSIARADSGLQIINRVGIEEYLRGVVPRELGVRAPSDRAALEAQAVAARSYAVTRLGNSARPFDLSATTSDQVYGGVEAENAAADAAIAATAGMVLVYEGRIVSAPYFSTCGGSTAEPTELWRSRSEPFLTRVSDRIPGSERFYCDIAPRFRWERTWRADTLTAVVERYVRAYAQVPPGPIGTVRGVSVDGRTPSGRVAAIVVATTTGSYRIRGNDVRYVLRSSGGELLNSTYFSPEVIPDSAGGLARLTIRGLGYGHGVGMCQWGAIGRARAGQDYRTILRTYFPGTSVARAY